MRAQIAIERRRAGLVRADDEEVGTRHRRLRRSEDSERRLLPSAVRVAPGHHRLSGVQRRRVPRARARVVARSVVRRLRDLHQRQRFDGSHRGDLPGVRGTRCARVRYVRSETNHGLSWNWNTLIAGARGVYFKTAAHDDLHARDYFLRTTTVLDERPDVVLCYPKTIDIDADGNELGIHPDNLDLQQATAHERLAHMLRYMRFCNPIFGVMRTEVLRSTGWMRPYGKADRVLLAEMCLRGKYVEYPEPLFYRRLFSGRSLEKYADSADLDRFHNTTAQAPSGYPWTRLFAAHVEAIRHVPLAGRRTSALLRGAVARVASLPRRSRGSRRRLRRRRAPAGRSARSGRPARRCRGAARRAGARRDPSCASLVVADQRVDRRAASAASSPAGTTNPVSPSIDGFGRTARLHRHDRRAARLGLDQRESERLGDGRVDEHVERAQHLGNVVTRADEVHAVAEQARRPRGGGSRSTPARRGARRRRRREVHRDASPGRAWPSPGRRGRPACGDPLARGCPRAARRGARRGPRARPGRQARARSVGGRRRGARCRRSAAHRPGTHAATAALIAMSSPATGSRHRGCRRPIPGTTRSC